MLQRLGVLQQSTTGNSKRRSSDRWPRLLVVVLPNQKAMPAMTMPKRKKKFYGVSWKNPGWKPPIIIVTTTTTIANRPRGKILPQIRDSSIRISKTIFRLSSMSQTKRINDSNSNSHGCRRRRQRLPEGGRQVAGATRLLDDPGATKTNRDSSSAPIPTKRKPIATSLRVTPTIAQRQGPE